VGGSGTKASVCRSRAFAIVVYLTSRERRPQEVPVEYLALIYADEGVWERMSDAERGAAYEQYREFAEAARAAGVMVGGDELSSTTTATTVRVRDGQRLVSDGPYAEVKEALGGYFILECPSFDDALEWATRIPAAEHGAVELRPVHVDAEA
jgi:hypothetical protein